MVFGQLELPAWSTVARQPSLRVKCLPSRRILGRGGRASVGLADRGRPRADRALSLVMGASSFRGQAVVPDVIGLSVSSAYDAVHEAVVGVLRETSTVGPAELRPT